MKLVRPLGLSVVLLVVCLSVWGDVIPIVAPDAVGLSSERLNRLTEVMQRYVEEGRIPGAVAIIARKGKIGYFETFGMQDKEAGIPMEKDTIFRIYSMSKAITGVAVMILYEEGHFFLNDPIRMYLPELSGMKVAVQEQDPKTGKRTITTVRAKRRVTIRDLLRHTSGITYGDGRLTRKFYREAGVGDDNQTLEEQVKKLGTTPLEFHPGTEWQYGLSIDVLGRLVEVVSGMPFDRFLEERIFEPLGMKDTAFYVPEEKHARLVKLYSPAKGNTIQLSESPAQDSYLKKPTLLSGGAGLVSTAMDYLRFCQMLLNDGRLDGVQILSRKSVELMRADHMVGIPREPHELTGEGTGFGLTFAVSLGPGRMGEIGSAGTYWWGGAAGTSFWIDPKEELTGVFMINLMPDTRRYRKEFQRLTYQAIVD